MKVPCRYRCPHQAQLLSWHCPKKSWIFHWDLQKANLFTIDPGMTTSNRKTQIKNKKCWSFNFWNQAKVVGINSYLFYYTGKIKNNHKKITSLATWITYFSLSFIYSYLGSTLCYFLSCKKSSIKSTQFLLVKTRWAMWELGKI